MRRFLTYGCFRSYELGMQALKDNYLACLSVSSPIFAIILTELRQLVESCDDLDLRWVNTAVLDDAVKWCLDMSKA